MRMSRSELKTLVKECLIELLSEGLGSKLTAEGRTVRSVASRGPTVQPQAIREQSRRRSPLDEPALPTAALRQAVKESSGGNSVLANILADTAATTLPKMLQNDRPGAGGSVPGGRVEQLVAAATPDQLFGEESASRWASLAFSDGPKGAGAALLQNADQG